MANPVRSLSFPIANASLSRQLTSRLRSDASRRLLLTAGATGVRRPSEIASRTQIRWRATNSRGQEHGPAPSTQRPVVEDVVSRESFYLPGAFITPSWTALLAKPRSMLWPCLTVRFRDWYARLAFRLSSFQRVSWWRGRTLWRSRPRTIPGAALELHRKLNEGMARGDAGAIKDACMPRLAETFLAAVEARPRGQKVEWSVEYGGAPSGPLGRLLGLRGRPASLVDHKLIVMPMGSERGAPTIVQRQAVVRVASRQRLARRDVKGALIPGSERVRDMAEYLVLHRFVLRPQAGVAAADDTAAAAPYRETPWKIYGTVAPTTAEAWKAEVEKRKRLETEDAEKKLRAV